jgi:hypothetical protein
MLLRLVLSSNGMLIVCALVLHHGYYLTEAHFPKEVGLAWSSLLVGLHFLFV